MRILQASYNGYSRGIALGVLFAFASPGRLTGLCNHQEWLINPSMARPLKAAVNIQNLLKVERVLIVNKHTEKNELIEKLVRKITDDYPSLSPEFLLDKILQREQGISTTMDTGLSIPHARVDGIDNFIVAMAVVPEGIIDPASPGAPIKAVFLFLSPADATFFQKHLQLLSILSAKFQPEFIERLVLLKTAAQVMHAVSEEGE